MSQSAPRASANPAELTIAVPDPQRAAQAVGELSGAGVAVSDFALARPSLDDRRAAVGGHMVSSAEPKEEER